MQNTNRYPKVYRIANEYVQAILGYEGKNMRATEAYNAVSAIAKENGWNAEMREKVWNSELRYAFKFWDVPVSQLMACNS